MVQLPLVGAYKLSCRHFRIFRILPVLHIANLSKYLPYSFYIRKKFYIFFAKNGIMVLLSVRDHHFFTDPGVQNSKMGHPFVIEYLCKVIAFFASLRSFLHYFCLFFAEVINERHRHQESHQPYGVDANFSSQIKYRVFPLKIA